MPGFVYFALNPSMPGRVKVGRTDQDPLARLAQLDTTGVPEPFYYSAVFRVTDPVACEREIHQALSGYRVRAEREFFCVGLAQALKEAADVVVRYVSDISASPAQAARGSSLLDNDQKEALYCLLYKRDGGYETTHLAAELDLHPLATEAKLSTLKGMGLVTEQKQPYGSNWWKLTSKGVQIAFELDPTLSETFGRTA